jgi:hypothetical protein
MHTPFKPLQFARENFSRYFDTCFQLLSQLLTSNDAAQKPKDPNLKSAVLEKVLESDGTDGSPYYIRDLGTIFFIQAAAKAIMSLSDQERITFVRRIGLRKRP